MSLDFAGEIRITNSKFQNPNFKGNDEVVKSRKRLRTVIPAPYQVRGKLQPESSDLR
jgi:hypothetical protein